MNGVKRLQGVGLLLGAATIVFACTHAAAQRQRPSARGRGFSRPELKVGQVAPDVELAPLELEKNKKGEMVPKIGETKIKLSAFKGKAPVCIFSSSYT